MRLIRRMLRPSLAAGLGVAAVCGSVATGSIIWGGAHAATRGSLSHTILMSHICKFSEI